VFDNILSFLDRHQSFILTTHDPSDPDGIGSELVMYSVLKAKGKKVKIINSSNVPKHLEFINNVQDQIEVWDKKIHACLLKDYALLILDTSEEFHLGPVREAVKKVKETFIIDHHEPKPFSKLNGYVDSTAASTAEITIAIACSLGINLDADTATAVYTGLVSDSGFFSYPKTSTRTFDAAIKAIEWGAVPNYIYKQLMENSSCSALLLQKQALANLEFYAGKKIALMILHNGDFEITGAEFEETENLVNIPLRAREIEVSILIKEKPSGEIFCSMRSKGKVNVAKIAHEFGGGGHLTAAGFRRTIKIEEIVKKILIYVESHLKM